jgi:hypothetical protein
MAAVNSPGGNIVGIASANGWFARFKNGETKPLACWAFFKRTDGADCVVGLISAGGGIFDPAEQMQNFADYVFKGLHQL